MRVIAVMTLIFLPLGTVAAVFGAQLINLEEEAPFRVHVSQDFWLLFAIAGPLTVVVWLVWYLWYHYKKAELHDETDRTVERSYTGWQYIKARFSGQYKGHKQS
jgi:Na+-driven multidrug efflux pump